MRIAILGAGSVGGVIAWHLVRAGAAPAIVARPESAALLAREGLTVTGPAGPQTVAVAATADPEALGPRDLVLVALKAQDWPAALPLLVPLLGPDTVLVPVLNGLPWWYFQGAEGRLAERRIAAVDPDGALQRAIPVRHILGGVVYIGAAREARNRIRWNGRKRLVLGEPTGGESPRLRRVAAFLAEAGLNAEATPDIRHAVWGKILGNVVHNPLSVVTGRDARPARGRAASRGDHAGRHAGGGRGRRGARRHGLRHRGALAPLARDDGFPHLHAAGFRGRPPARARRHRGRRHRDRQGRRRRDTRAGDGRRARLRALAGRAWAEGAEAGKGAETGGLMKARRPSRAKIEG